MPNSLMLLVPNTIQGMLGVKLLGYLYAPFPRAISSKHDSGYISSEASWIPVCPSSYVPSVSFKHDSGYISSEASWIPVCPFSYVLLVPNTIQGTLAVKLLGYLYALFLCGISFIQTRFGVHKE